MIICLDSGHGGKDPGAVRGGIFEKDLNLKVIKHLKTMLEEKKHIVILTNDNNSKYEEKLSLQERCNIANNNDCDLFISVHHNVSVSPDSNGAITFYHRFSEKGELLARCISEEFEKNIFTPQNLMYSYENFYVLRHTKMPAVLVECGFMSNYKELQKLKMELTQIENASCINEGIKKYINS